MLYRFYTTCIAICLLNTAPCYAQKVKECVYANSTSYFVEAMKTPTQAITNQKSELGALGKIAFKGGSAKEIFSASWIYLTGVESFESEGPKCIDVEEKICDFKSASFRYLTKAFTDETPVDYTPFLLPDSHSVKPLLDAIFSQAHVLESGDSLLAAGFKEVSSRPSSMRVLSHPLFPEYLIKIYPHNEKDNRTLRTPLWAYKRCAGAENIRQLIKKNKLKHFCVPRKWVYFLPNTKELQSLGNQNCALLVVDNMPLLSRKECIQAWLKADRAILKELYCILSKGYSSCLLNRNIPYTKLGKFSCVDTENIQRKLPYEHVKKHISPNLHRYWDKLVKKGGNTPGFHLTGGTEG